MSYVLVVKTDEKWVERKKRWFDIELSDDVKLTDLKYVCIYNGDGTGGANDHGGYVLKVKEWSVSEVDGLAKRTIGIGAYSGKPGHFFTGWKLIDEGVISLESVQTKSVARFETELEWVEIPIGPRAPDFGNLAIDLQTAKQSVANFYGFSASQVFIKIQC